MGLINAFGKGKVCICRCAAANQSYNEVMLCKTERNTNSRSLSHTHTRALIPFRHMGFTSFRSPKFTGVCSFLPDAVLSLSVSLLPALLCSPQGYSMSQLHEHLQQNFKRGKIILHTLLFRQSYSNENTVTSRVRTRAHAVLKETPSVQMNQI